MQTNVKSMTEIHARLLILPLSARVSCFTEPWDWCSSSLPRTQSTVVLIKLCAALLTSSPMVILGRRQCEGPAVNHHASQSGPPLVLTHSFSLNQPHLSKHWAWVWLWNLSGYCCFLTTHGKHGWVSGSATRFIFNILKLLRCILSVVINFYNDPSDTGAATSSNGGEKSCQCDLSLSPWLWHGLSYIAHLEWR